MIDASLIKILKNLSVKEFNKFALFVQSPYFNKDEFIISLIKHLKKIHPNYVDSEIDKHQLFNEIFKNETFDYLKLRRLFSAALKLLEQFFLTEFQKKNQIESNIDLMITLKERGLDKRFQKVNLKTNALIRETSLKDKNYYYSKYRYLHQIDEWLVQNDDYSKPRLLQEAIDNLDRFYLIEKLNQSTVMLNRSDILQTRTNEHTFDNPLAPEIVAYLKNHEDDFKNHPSILIYFKRYLSSINPNDESSYFDLCQLVEENIEHFSPQDGQFLYYSLLYYAYKKINSGKSIFFKHAFDLQKNMLKQGFLMQNGILTDQNYRNLVTSALALKEYDWAYNFIETNYKHLPKKIQSNAYNFSLANYYCEIGEYDKAQDLLISVVYKNLFYSLNAKAILLRVYYETNAEEALDSHVTAFKVYLMRSKMINKAQYKRYYNLFRFAGALFKIKTDSAYHSKTENSLKMQKLQKKIQSAGRLPFSRWLKTQMQLVEKNIS